MSQSGWYHDKAAECNRLALASTSAASSKLHISDRDNWQGIAARIESAEEAVRKRKAKVAHGCRATRLSRPQV
jgi:hypothetical protein